MASICNDTTRQVLDSGAIFWDDLQEKPILRHFVETVKRHVLDLTPMSNPFETPSWLAPKADPENLCKYSMDGIPPY